MNYYRLSLNVMTIEVDSPGVYTAQGVALKVTGVAQVTSLISFLAGLIF